MIKQICLICQKLIKEQIIWGETSLLGNTYIDSSSFALKSSLASLKTEVNKLGK